MSHWRPAFQNLHYHITALIHTVSPRGQLFSEQQVNFGGRHPPTHTPDI
jgi:hypothetical protein